MSRGDEPPLGEILVTLAGSLVRDRGGDATMMTVAAQNLFAAQRAAKRYAVGRPYHHGRTLERALARLRPRPVGLALDVASGTGLSTRALAELGYPVVGLDAVPAMAQVAHDRETPPFLVGAAKSLPIRGATVSLLTVASGLHWFAQARFYQEVLRVLRPQGVPRVALWHLSLLVPVAASRPSRRRCRPATAIA